MSVYFEWFLLTHHKYVLSNPVLPVLCVIRADILQVSFLNDGHELLMGCYLQFENTVPYFGRNCLLLEENVVVLAAK